MSVPFVSRRRNNPFAKDAEGKFFPAAAHIAEIGINRLAEEISQSTSLTPAEVIGVIRSLLLIVPRYLLLGYKVRLDSFGLFRLGLRKSESCKGYEKATEVTARDIEGVRMMFRPDAMLEAKLKSPSYVKLDARYLTDDSEQDARENLTDEVGADE